VVNSLLLRPLPYEPVAHTRTPKSLSSIRRACILSGPHGIDNSGTFSSRDPSRG
jgi:hypothetical protein